MDVLAVFKEGDRHPTPLRFKINEAGEEKSVAVGRILGKEDVGAGGMARIEYSCVSTGARGEIKYILKYYYNKGSWELERTL